VLKTASSCRAALCRRTASRAWVASHHGCDEAFQPVPDATRRQTFREKYALYSCALGLVYASHYEGFALPLLEAMRCGCPRDLRKQQRNARGRG
jgi:glycosyltransferase involved in cell wall biosynthesis